MLTVGVQLSEAMSELHLFGLIVGGDLTPHSLTITPAGDIKVGDFTASRYSIVPPPLEIPIRYRAAELFTESNTVIPKSTIKSDIYAFGCVMYAVTMGYEPWNGLNENEIRTAVIGRRETPILPTNLNLDDRYLEVIKRCTKYDAADRPTFDECATILKSLLDAKKTRVPVSQVAPFGFANLVSVFLFLIVAYLLSCIVL